MEYLLAMGVALITGLLMTRVAKRLQLPAVTAYLITGVLLGPYCLGALGVPGLGFVSTEFVESFGLLSQLALGFIAFAIGSEFRLAELKHTGRQAVIVGIFQALTAMLLVDAALLALCLFTDKMTVPAAITMGAIATATAPAATLMVVRQYKAKGKLTSLLLPVVALDDAVGLVVFAISFGIARAMLLGHTDLVSIFVNPLLEIVLSLALGAVLGYFLTWLEKLFNSNSNRLSLSIGFVALTVGLCSLKFEIGAVHIGFSNLLTCMMLGTVFCNICPLSEDLMERADKWTAPLLALFFIISGAELELHVFTDLTIVGIGLIYILFRSAGKISGAYISAKASGCDEKVCKYLGITLLPQAGVALGMCIMAMELGECGHLIRNITLFSVLIYELVGPLMTKMALTAAGDIKPMAEEIKNRREIKLQNLEKKK